MLSTANLRVTNFSAIILKLTGIGGLLAWLLPTHCLNPLGIVPSFQRAFRQCVGHVQAMVALPGRLLACLVPTDCLRSLGNWPSFHRALRQYVGNPEAIYPLYDKVRQQPDGSYAFGFGSFYTDLLRWTGQLFLSPLKQIVMAVSKEPGADKIMNDPAYVHARETMSEFGWAGKAASKVHEIFRDRTMYAKDNELQARLFTGWGRIVSTDSVNKRGERIVGSLDINQKSYTNSVFGVKKTKMAICIGWFPLEIVVLSHCMENTLTTQSEDVNLIYNQAAELLLEQKLPAEQCIQAMVSNGIGEEQARNAVADIQGQILSAKKERAKKDILYGGLWCAGGTIGTVANTGFIFWGAIVFGGVQLIRGLINSSATE